VFAFLEILVFLFTDCGFKYFPYMIWCFMFMALQKHRRLPLFQKSEFQGVFCRLSLNSESVKSNDTLRTDSFVSWNKIESGESIISASFNAHETLCKYFRQVWCVTRIHNRNNIITLIYEDKRKTVCQQFSASNLATIITIIIQN